MRKKAHWFRWVEILLLITGVALLNSPTVPSIIPVMMISTSFAWLAMTRGGTRVMDEMVMRAVSLSGHYTSIATLYFIFALSILNYFFPLPLSTGGLLLLMMVYISFSYILIQYMLMTRGKTE